tara:strand:+ start:575 stop:910 length:336 start_codon:yes stop_codon:yes gene_type:complete
VRPSKRSSASEPLSRRKSDGKRSSSAVKKLRGSVRSRRNVKGPTLLPMPRRQHHDKPLRREDWKWRRRRRLELHHQQSVLSPVVTLPELWTRLCLLSHNNETIWASLKLLA